MLTDINDYDNIILVLDEDGKIKLLKKFKCGYYSREDTPVSIPNTEVKLFSAEGTWWEAAWENRT